MKLTRLEINDHIVVRRLKLMYLAPFWVLLGPFAILWENREEYVGVFSDIRKAWGGGWA